MAQHASDWPHLLPAGKKADKKKGKGGKADNNDEDIDALLAIIDGPKQLTKQAEAAVPVPTAAEPAAMEAEAGGDDEEGGKELTAAQKKKMKKKLKEKEKKTAAADGTDIA